MTADFSREKRRAYMRAYLKKYYASNKERLLTQQREKRAANLQQARAVGRKNQKANYAANPQAWAERSRKYLSTQKGKDTAKNRYLKFRHKRRAKLRKWKKEHPDRVNAWTAKRHAAKMNAMPKWADKTAIAAVFKEASNRTIETGTPYNVDHICPLNSPIVCGLHVAHNLRVVTKTENISKSNRLIAHILTSPSSTDFVASANFHSDLVDSSS